MNDKNSLEFPGTDFGERIAELSPDKRALLLERLSEAQKRLGAGEAGAALPITPVPRSGDLPLSFAQQRLWFLDRLLPDKAAYNIATAWRLQGRLDVPALERSLDALVARHETLRTRFTLREGAPVQVIDPAQPVALPLTDLSALAPAAREARARQLAEMEARQPFDLEAGPPLRTQLLRLAADEHWLLLTVHHIASDGWSVGVLQRELKAAYAAFVQGTEPEWPALPIQYADYAAWQRQWLQGEVLERQLGYWKSRLADISPLDLPTDRPRPPVASHQGAHLAVDVSAPVSGALTALGRREGATLFMTLLAAFHVLLSRYSGQADMAVGTPMAGRGRTELEGLIGFFVNTLVLRSDLSGNPRFREVLTRVRDTALGAYTHQDLPFEKLVEEVAPARDLSRHPLFQVLFVLQNAPGARLALAGLEASRLGLEGHSAKFDLTLSVRESAAGLRLSWEYATDLFDAATIARMAGHFQVLLEAIVADPEQRIGELPILTAAERHQVLVAWNDTATDYPRDRGIHQLFEAQAARTPEAVAVVCDARHLTYAELNARANQLAHHLIALGVGPEVLVGICLERSLELVVGLLGILKAGGAYVPLDPSYPPARLAFMLADTHAPVLLTQQELLDQLPPYAGRILCLDRDGETIATQPDSDPPCHVTAENLAYVIYTSGSTGSPKGVAVPHRGVLRLLLGTDYVQLDARQTFLLLSPISFDASTFELWGALLHGARCAIFREPVPTVDTLGEILQRYQVSTVWLTASLFNVIVDEAPQILGGVRQLLIGGEALSPTHVRAALTRLPDVRLINGYGPTESTTFACCYRIPQALEDTRLSIPIGRPIGNTHVYVLDRYLSPAPIGVAGELCIGGDGLARGYLNRAELTAEKFLPDPFSTVPGARLYRTGDMARYLPDGNIEFLGRIDDQVKIRGFRIELGEIETVLAEHPAVREAVVLAREDTPGDKRLVAYVVPADPSSIEIESLRVVLRERLPEYLRPSAYVALERLPLSPNGKVDRRSLPAPQFGRGEAGDTFVAPRDALEELVAGVWREVLKLERVGVHDNFFELGGHSLLATQVLARVARVLKVELALRGFFESPTVSALAAEARKRLGAGEAGAALPMTPVPRGGDLPLSFAQQRLWVLDRLLPDKAAYNIPAAWRLQGRLDVPALERSLGALVARHETLRTRIVLRDGEPVQVIDPAQAVALPRTDLSALAPAAREARARALAETEARQPFDLAAGPLLRAQLLRLAPEEHWLLLTVHHIASDGWSVGVLQRELAAAYAAFVQGTEPEWPALPIQYADYAVWQRAWLQGPVLEEQLGYWKHQLGDLPPLELPTDRPRPPVASHQGAQLAFDLPAPLSRALAALGRGEGATLFMTLLAAFQVLLSRYSGQEDITVGSPMAGRGRTELEGLIGFFVNTLVLRSDLSGNPGFRELLARVRDTALGAYTHQDLPFEKLVEELAPARDLSRHPLFQVLFVLQNAPGAGLALAGLEASRLGREGHSAKFDLTVAVRESAAGLRLSWEYATDLFDAATIARMTGHFQVLLEAIVADPGQRIGELPLLTAAERQQLLVAWNDTAADYPRDRCIHQLFEAQAARTPEAVAVVCEDRHLTYAKLNARANQLAHHLIALGVGPEVLVGICMERSLDLIVGVLGILKAGGAYVPLDPSYPTERLAFMLTDTHAPVLLTQQGLVAQLPPFDGHVLCLDRDWPSIAAQPTTDPRCPATAESLAYVIYTSGSTGTPKGVAVPHRGITRLVCNTDYLEIDTTDCVAQISNPAFDAATFEIWGALANGSRLIIIPREVALDAPRLADELQRGRVSTLFLTTALFNEVARDRPRAFAGLKQVLFGGEAVDPHWVGECLRAGGPQRMLHVYGPTESTTFTTWHPVEAVAPGERTIPIGRPIANTTIYVLDRNRQPVPPGVAGELYIGGDGLARGYWNRPELTAECFVPDPFSAHPRARLYHTGDLVRRKPNGDLEFLGRLDAQVKIRGFRIELGEIEVVLGEHPAVRQAVVLAREDVLGDKRLVAYVVPADPAWADVEGLRALLRERLPEYMRPSAYVVLEQLPLTPNGKVDRRSLPRPSRALENATRGHDSPRDNVERTLCQLWAEVLGITQVGIDANFFELGGHSLLAARLFARLDRAFGRSLPLATLFNAPTVRELARFYRDGAEPAVGTALVPITAGGSLPRVFAVPGVGGNVLCFCTLAGDLGPEQPFFGLQSVGLDGASEPLESIEHMAAHYLREVRQIQPRGPYHLLGACFGATVAFEMTRQLLDAGEEVAFLGLFDPSSLGGDLAGQPALPLPAWLKLCAAFASFVASRLQLYREEMRTLGYRLKVQFVGSKLKIVSEIVHERDVFRGDHREFHQRRVYDANLRALLRYKHEPLTGGAKAIEIFGTGRRFDRAPVDSRVDWISLAGGPIPYHKVPGKNSGDMLRGDNAKILASILSIRLQHARRA